MRIAQHYTPKINRLRWCSSPYTNCIVPQQRKISHLFLVFCGIITKYYYLCMPFAKKSQGESL
jgi:hypothetical protein